MEQKLRTCSSQMIERISTQREWVRGHFVDQSTSKYDSIEGKLYLLEGILSKGFIESNETWKLQSLGIVLGDALAQKLDLNWIEVEDEYGVDPALRFKDSSVIAFPLTMISKRVEKGEQVDIRVLFEGMVDLISQQVKSL